MQKSCRSRSPACEWGRRAFALAAAVGCALQAAAQGPDPAVEATAEGPERPVRVVRLVLPLTGADDQAYLGRLQRAVDALKSAPRGAGDQRPLLVLEFTPSEGGGATGFERALRLARFLVGEELAAVNTVAYLPRSIDGHAVLVALACEEIAMAPDAEFGRAGIDEDASRPVEPSVRAAYQQIAESRRTAPPAVVVAMVDRAAELVRFETDRGIDYALRDRADELRAERTVVSEEVLSPAGSLAVFTGRQAREQGFVKYLVDGRPALARALSAPVDRLTEDQSLVEEWRPVMIDLEGPLTPRLARRVETLLGDELERSRVNWIGVRIDSRGGDWTSGLRLARTLAELGDGEARTVAYVPREALGPAALVALACDQLVMHDDATLGEASDAPEPGFALLPPGADDGPETGPEEDPVEDPEEGAPARRPLDRAPGDAQAPAEDLAETDSVVATIRDSLAAETGRGWSLLAATADRRIGLTRYTNRQTGEARLMGEEELESLGDRADWLRGETLKPAGEPLRLNGRRAAETEIAWRSVEQFDDLRALYGFAETPRTAQPNWALELVEALASPGFAAMLLVIGLVGVYIELNTPGLGLGGFVASVAMLLFFWSKFLDGTADWLEVLLFVSGVVFVLVEVIVLPGLGVFGLGGGLLILASLVLASQTFVLPQTESQLVELRNSLAVVAGSGLACLVAGVALRQYLPHSPLFRRATLMPPDPEDRIEQERREQLADYDHLVGRTGTTTTDLLPAGRAEIDGEPVDVITRGNAIDRGERVEVVEAHANRVVVRRVRG